MDDSADARNAFGTSSDAHQLQLIDYMRRTDASGWRQVRLCRAFLAQHDIDPNHVYYHELFDQMITDMERADRIVRDGESILLPDDPIRRNTQDQMISNLEEGRDHAKMNGTEHVRPHGIPDPMCADEALSSLLMPMRRIYGMLEQRLPANHTECSGVAADETLRRFNSKGRSASVFCLRDTSIKSPSNARSAVAPVSEEGNVLNRKHGSGCVSPAKEPNDSDTEDHSSADARDTRRKRRTNRPRRSPGGPEIEWAPDMTPQGASTICWVRCGCFIGLIVAAIVICRFFVIGRSEDFGPTRLLEETTTVESSLPCWRLALTSVHGQPCGRLEY